MVNSYKGFDRRESLRVKAEFIVIYKVNSPLEIYMWIGNREVHALMLDLSENGMAILTEHSLPVSTILLSKFTLINLCAEKSERIRSMEITGQVRNSVLSKGNEYRLGIFFTKITTENKCAIASFVKMAAN
ncbi:MAG: PilZ domain-containing protein [Candidatus Omnitrophota bacterium]